MHRFYLPPDQCEGEILLLGDREAHHALHVLRLRSGEQVLVLNGTGQECLCETLQPKGNEIGLAVLRKRSISPLTCQITLAQALPKGKLFEAIVQKATELGAARIIPLLSDRVVAHLEERDKARKTAKWRWIAIDALKQSGASRLPEI